MDDFELRSSFIDICNGFSSTTWCKNAVYLRHFSHFEQFELEKERKFHYDTAVARKIETKEQKLKWLDAQKLWTKDDERKLVQAKSYAENLKKTRDKAAIKSQINLLQKQLDAADTEFYKLDDKKRSFVGMTAESYADQKMQNAYVFLSFYKDSGLKERLFTQKEFKRLDEDDIYELLDLYIPYVSRFTQETLRKISISSFFTDSFYLTEDVTKFFGKPIMSMTFNQVNLSSYAGYFKKLLTNYEIPDKIRDDPTEIEKYVIRLQNKKSMNLPQEGRVGVVGATKEGDGEIFGQEEDYISKLIKAGGVTDMFDAHNKTKNAKN